MNVADVADEVRAALDTIQGLHVPEWGVKRASGETALVTLPERIEYDATYGRGTDRIPDLAVIILVPRPTTPEAVRAVAKYADGSGDHSVKAAVERHTYTACDTVRVASVEFDIATYVATEYLAAMFHLDITGKGS
ncbi:hypothetical protein ACIBF5_32485 [Micromonospora sp. NPDC050417]|uniref:hypothetical protein n=1 Tax=Micromonospora sp. NPDC050417 TaxID=3364280 RepID=UPI00379D1F0D